MSYLVGIDIAKYKHDCFIMTDDGVVIRESFSFPNNKEGFERLKVALDTLDHSQKIKVGLEVTGHYGRNLKQFLTYNNYEFSELNPYLVKRFVESITLRRTKTDKVDAMMIAKFIQIEASKPNPIISYNINELKTLVRARNKLVRMRSDQLVIITNCLDRIFPEFKEFFNGRLGETALTILEKYSTPKKISKLTALQIEKLHNLSRTISSNKLVRLTNLAENTIGHHSDADVLIIKQSSTLFRVIDNNIKKIEQSIETIMKEVKSPIASIPGIGLMSVAAIHAEFGDLRRFRTAVEMLAYAGLECSRCQSGESDYRGRMVKHGSSHLRYVLINIAVSVKNHCPTFATYYLKKRDEGKVYRVALSHVVRKLLRVIYKLVILNEKYDVNLSK